jgi:hypothetical protein
LYAILFDISNVFANSTSEEPPPVSLICKNQPRCDFLATQKKWPKEVAIEDAVTFSNLAFDIRFPSGFDKVAVIWNELPLYMVIYKNKKISIGMENVPSEETSSDFPSLLDDKTRSSWLPIDIFKIIFSKKPNDMEPANTYERYLWRTAFLYKAITYAPSSDAFVYTKGPWTAYTAKVGDPTNDRFTVVTHREYPNRYLTIRDSGASLEFIEKLISTIKLN